MNSRTPAVSVVIPTYNRAHVVERAIQSVAGQTYTDYELILVDDASTDGTAGLAARLEAQLNGRLRYIRCETNGGAAAARNRGIQSARGTYVAFLDADDEWAPRKLELQVEQFKSAPPEVGLITTGYVLVDRYGRPTLEHPLYPKEGDLSSAMPDFIGGRGEIVGVFSTLMFRRSVAEEIGGLDETLRCWEDADFYFRAAGRYHFAFMPERLTVKHDSADSISANWSLEATGVRSFWQKYGPNPRVGSRPQFRRYIARHQHGVAVLACLSGNVAEGRRLFLESLAIVPVQWHAIVHLLLSLSGARGYARILSMRNRFRRAGA